jgi:hypothetical protein
MRLHFVTVPNHGSAAAEEELNQFLATHRVLAVDRQLVADGPRSAWAICVTFPEAGTGAATADANKKRVDYCELIPDADFQVFARLRDLRKQIAVGETQAGAGVEVAVADAPSNPRRWPTSARGAGR